MDTFVALFRGINVGGTGLLPMESLRQLLTELGCVKVRTYIQSGNAVFEYTGPTAKLADSITEKISNTHGFAPLVLLRKQTELRKVLQASPYSPSDGKQLHVFFMAKAAAKPDIERLQTLKSETEQFTIRGKAFYLFAPDGIARSKLASSVEKCLGVPVTARNWNTLNKLIEL